MTSPVAKLHFVMYIYHDKYALFSQADGGAQTTYNYSVGSERYNYLILVYYGRRVLSERLGKPVTQSHCNIRSVIKLNLDLGNGF